MSQNDSNRHVSSHISTQYVYIRTYIGVLTSVCIYIYIYIHTYIHTIIVQHVLNITMCNKIHGTLQFQMQPFSNAFKRAHVPSYPNRVSRSDVFQRFQTHTHTRSYLHVQIAFPDLTFSNVSKRVMSNTTNATAASL